MGCKSTPSMSNLLDSNYVQEQARKDERPSIIAPISRDVVAVVFDVDAAVEMVATPINNASVEKWSVTNVSDVLQKIPSNQATNEPPN